MSWGQPFRQSNLSFVSRCEGEFFRFAICMLLRSVVLIDSAGHVLFSRHFSRQDLASDEAAAEWERALFRLTSAPGKLSWAHATDEDVIASHGDWRIVYRAHADVVYIACGDCSYTDLATFLAALVDVVQDQTNQGDKESPSTPAAIVEHYAQVCVAVDVMVSPAGMIEELDLDRVRSAVVLKD